MVRVFDQDYAWTPEDGLDPIAVASVDRWIFKQANHLRYPAARAGASVDDLIQGGRVGARGHRPSGAGPS
jgi:hypothetical protein